MNIMHNDWRWDDKADVTYSKLHLALSVGFTNHSLFLCPFFFLCPFYVSIYRKKNHYILQFSRCLLEQIQ